MKKSKAGYLVIAFLLVCVSAQCFFCAATCSASERVYQITDQELTQWEQELKLQKSLLNQAEKHNAQSHQELNELKAELKTLRSQSQLQETQLKIAEQALNAANSSLEAYAKEQKRKQAKIKRQRSIAYMVAIGALLFAAK